MTTPRTRRLVSLAAALTISLALGACASAPGGLAREGSAVTSNEPPVMIPFDNGARDYVRVYLVSPRREWLLGRVEPGARTTLRVPDDALADDAGPLRLAVLVGGRITLRAADESRAATTLPLPVTELGRERWSFSQSVATGQLTLIPVGRARSEASPR